LFLVKLEPIFSGLFCPLQADVSASGGTQEVPDTLRILVSFPSELALELEFVSDDVVTGLLLASLDGKIERLVSPSTPKASRRSAGRTNLHGLQAVCEELVSLSHLVWPYEDPFSQSQS